MVAIYSWTGFIVIFIFMLVPLTCFGQDAGSKFVVSGFVTDVTTGELLPGASVFSTEARVGTITNVYGFFSISLPMGQHTIVTSYLGFLSASSVLEVNRNIRFSPLLTPRLLELPGVDIAGSSSVEQRRSTFLGIEKIEPGDLRIMPALFGEVDPLKTIQLFPGIVSTSEGSISLSVRGGNPDQNLVIFDDATVYNPGHLLGFFSIFNNDAIKSVEIYKGDLPAWGGGRIASLIDVRSRDGNMHELAGVAGVGLIASRVTLEGPIKKGVSSFLISGRRTYLDMFLPLARDRDIRDNKLYFYDTNIKLNFIAGENDRFFVSGYFGRDVFRNQMAGLNYGNRILTFRWNHLFSQKLFSNATLVTSRYDYFLETTGEDIEAVRWKSRLNDLSFKYAFTYYPETGNLIEFGVQSIYHSINPGHVSTPGENAIINEIIIPVSNSLEHILYFSHTKQLNSSVSIRCGLRFSLFQNIGRGRVFKYDENFEIADTLYHEPGEIFNHYAGLEPRFGISWLLSPTLTLRGSFANTRQYLHLASNTSSTTPLDVWFTSSPNIKPQVSNQLSVGLDISKPGKPWKYSVEMFWKKNRNAIDFKEHPELLLNEALEGEIRGGRAFSKGLELLARYNGGVINGWIAYTLSRSVRQSDWINQGETYPSPFDHPHNIAAVVNYVISPRVQFSGNWIYYTGAPVTLPVGRFDFQGGVIPIYSKRNAERMPDYHRLDMAITVQGNNPPSRSWKGEWNFSVYNLYGRKNAWMINFTGDDDVDPFVKKAEKTYLFSIVPSVSYSIRF